MLFKRSHARVSPECSFRQHEGGHIKFMVLISQVCLSHLRFLYRLKIALKKLKVGKAFGIIGITAAILKHGDMVNIDM